MFYLTLYYDARKHKIKIAGGSSLCHTAKWGSTCNHNYLYRWLPCQYFILLMMGAWRPKQVEKVCSNKICILLRHVGVLFNPVKVVLQSCCSSTQKCCQLLTYLIATGKKTHLFSYIASVSYISYIKFCGFIDIQKDYKVTKLLVMVILFYLNVFSSGCITHLIRCYIL